MLSADIENRKRENRSMPSAPMRHAPANMSLLNGVRDLANFLATSEDAQNAFIERLFHCLVKQPVRAFGPRTLSEMRKFFVEHDFNIRKLMVEMTAIEEKAHE